MRAVTTRRDRRVAALALLLLAAYLLAAYHGGRDSYVRINDHLDGIVPMYRLLSETQPVLGAIDARVEAIFDGLPRNSLPSTLHLGVLLYYGLDPFWAHVANETILRTLALVGMGLLLRRRALPEGDPRLVWGCALAFSLLPWMPTAYASVAGQPLLAYALLEIHERRGRAWPWAYLLFFAFYSSLVFMGIFVLLFLALAAAWELLARRRLHWGLVGAGALLTAGFVVCEYRLLYQTLLDTDYVSHRSAFERSGSGFLFAGYRSVLTFLTSQRHAPSLQAPFELAAAALALGLGALRLPGAGLGGRLRRGWAVLRGRAAAPVPRGRELLLVLLACGGVALAAGYWRWGPVQEAIDASSLLRMLNLHRIGWVHPTLFALAFAYALHGLARAPRAGRAGPLAAFALLGLQLAWVGANTHAVAVWRDEGLTFREYYSRPLFHEVKEAIGRPTGSYEVLSFAFPPGIALYNGFHVLNGFVNDYPLSYKRRFRRVIAPELERSRRLRLYFDRWGGMVDLFSSELGRVNGYTKTLYTKDAATRAVEDLALDPRALRDLGADYLLSAVEIRNHRELGLELRGVFERTDSPWRIRLYAVEGWRRSARERTPGDLDTASETVGTCPRPGKGARGQEIRPCSAPFPASPASLRTPRSSCSSARRRAAASPSTSRRSETPGTLRTTRSRAAVSRSGARATGGRWTTSSSSRSSRSPTRNTRSS